MRHAVKRWLLTSFTLLVLYLGLGESIGQSPFWNQVDKGIHFLLFGLFSFFAVLLVRQAPMNRAQSVYRWIWLALIIASACIVGELVHLVVPGRTFEMGDMVANFMGSIVFSALAVMLIPSKKLSIESPEKAVLDPAISSGLVE